MANSKKPQKPNELVTQYEQVFNFSGNPLSDLSQPDLRGYSVSVTTYGAYEKPIEGWSAANAKLGTDT